MALAQGSGPTNEDCDASFQRARWPG